MSVKPPPRSENDPELAEALSKLSEGLKEGEDPFFYDWRAKPRPRAISSGGVDEARAYVPPTTVPPTTAHKTFEMQRVKIAPQVDPRRQPTMPRMGTSPIAEGAAAASAPDEALSSPISSSAPPRPREPFLPAVSPAPGPAVMKPAATAEIVDEPTPPTVRESAPPPPHDSGALDSLAGQPRPPTVAGRGSAQELSAAGRPTAPVRSAPVLDEHDVVIEMPVAPPSDQAAVESTQQISPVPRSVTPVTREPRDPTGADAAAAREYPTELGGADADRGKRRRTALAVFATAGAIGCAAAVVLVLSRGPKSPEAGRPAAGATAIEAPTVAAVTAPTAAEPEPLPPAPPEVPAASAPQPSANAPASSVTRPTSSRARDGAGAAKRSGKVRGAAPTAAPPTAAPAPAEPAKSAPAATNTGRWF